MTAACEACLRRAYLVGHLAPRIAGLLDRPAGRAPGLLSLPDADLLAAIGGDVADGRAFLDRFDARQAARGLERAEVDAVCRHDDAYPGSLEELADPPPVLFLSGGRERLLALTGDATVALVGTRGASAYGREVAYSLGRGLGAAGVTVVSGLALGIDAAAHRGCLDVGGHAIAVLANGPDNAYPRRNERLWRSLSKHGVVLSELPPGQRAFRWSFPARNRIMAGLAHMTVVVEAGDPSGSLITASFAADLGRVVAAVPGRVTSRLAAGVNALLKDGARLVTGAEDVLDELFGPTSDRRAEPPPSPPLEPPLGAVLDAVEAGEGVEGIARAVAIPAGAARAALTQLEAAGYVVRRGLAGYERTTRR